MNPGRVNAPEKDRISFLYFVKSIKKIFLFSISFHLARKIYQLLVVSVGADLGEEGEGGSDPLFLFEQ